MPATPDPLQPATDVAVQSDAPIAPVDNTQAAVIAADLTTASSDALATTAVSTANGAAQAAAAAAPPVADPTLEDVKSALRTYYKLWGGYIPTISLLLRYGVRLVTDLKPEQYKAIFDEANNSKSESIAITESINPPEDKRANAFQLLAEKIKSETEVILTPVATEVSKLIMEADKLKDWTYEEVHQLWEDAMGGDTPPAGVAINPAPDANAVLATPPSKNVAQKAVITSKTKQ